MTIQNCTVTSGTSNSRRIQIIDESGCTKFPNFIPDIVYNGDLDAGMQTQAFSLDVDQVTPLLI